MRPERPGILRMPASWSVLSLESLIAATCDSCESFGKVQFAKVRDSRDGLAEMNERNLRGSSSMG